MGEPNPSAESASWLNLLLTKATAGDKAALAVVYQAYFVPVFRFVLKRVGAREAAEDIAQTVFLKIYTARAPWEWQNKPPLSYLFTVARHAITDHWRKNSREPYLPLDETTHSTVDPKDALAKVEASDTISAGLAELNETERRVVILKCIEGYSTLEVASALQLSESNVRQLQCRAFKLLKAKLS